MIPQDCPLIKNKFTGSCHNANCEWHIKGLGKCRLAQAIEGYLEYFLKKYKKGNQIK